jgi:hypothetical protein
VKKPQDILDDNDSLDRAYTFDMQFAPPIMRPANINDKNVLGAMNEDLLSDMIFKSEDKEPKQFMFMKLNNYDSS